MMIFKKLFLLLPPTITTYIFLGKKSISFLNKIIGKPTMVAAWKLSAATNAQRML